jgi:hypothetical protein
MSGSRSRLAHQRRQAVLCEQRIPGRKDADFVSGGSLGSACSPGSFGPWLNSNKCTRVSGSNGTKNSAKVFSFVDSSDSSRVKWERGHHNRGVAPEVQLERRLIARLKTANIRFTDAQVERIWAIVSAHQTGLSIRKIAGATGLSSSRIHQLLNAPEAKEIPVWLSQLRQSSRGSSGKK